MKTLTVMTANGFPRRARAVAASLAVALAAGCASSDTAPAGFVRLDDAFAVAMAPQWTDITYEIGTGHRRVRVFTWDGPRLNQLYLAGGLPEGETLVRAEADRPTPPPYRRGASRTSQVAFVGGTLAALGYRNVALEPPADRVFVQLAGMRVRFRASTGAGLRVSGVAALSESPDGLNVGLFVAPAEHYAGARAQEVEQILDSATRTFDGA